jgi:hypothetical protein
LQYSFKYNFRGYEEGVYGLWQSKEEVRQEDWDRQLEEVSLVRTIAGDYQDGLKAVVEYFNVDKGDYDSPVEQPGLYDFRTKTWTIHIRGRRGSVVAIQDKNGNQVGEKFEITE